MAPDELEKIPEVERTQGDLHLQVTAENHESPRTLGRKCMQMPKE